MPFRIYIEKTHFTKFNHLRNQLVNRARELEMERRNYEEKLVEFKEVSVWNSSNHNWSVPHWKYLILGILSSMWPSVAGP